MFANSYFGQKIIRKELPLPSPTKLPNSDTKAPFYFAADAAFPLALHIMKPYGGINLTSQQETFNKRISRARQTIENSFGILTARWRILFNTIHMEPENAEKLVLACIALHNFIMLDNLNKQQYCPPQFTDWIDSNCDEHPGEWRSEIAQNDSLRPSAVQHRFNGNNATQLRNSLCYYFNN